MQCPSAQGDGQIGRSREGIFSVYSPEKSADVRRERTPSASRSLISIWFDGWEMVLQVATWTAPDASRSAYAWSAKTACTPMQTGGGRPARFNWTTASIIVPAEEMM